MNNIPTTAAEVLGKTPAPRRIKPEWIKYARRLLKLRERLLQEHADLKEQAAWPLSFERRHLADSATDEFDQDTAWALLVSEQNALYEIDQALGRIENGTYGLCEITGQPIPAERLEAVPWTRFSLLAAAEREQKK